jgi:uncharacterized coiled-coil DUF342 family protein
MKKDKSPPELFTFSLEAINSAFGISADTLRALAQSYGIEESQLDKLIVRVLTQWAKQEIPDLDLDSPELTAEQLKKLADRCESIKKINQSTPSLLELFKEIDGDKGGANETQQLVSRNGGDS